MGKVELAHTYICDKHAQMKSLRLKKRTSRWMTPDIITLMDERDHVHAKATQVMSEHYGNITVISGIK